MTFLVFVKKSLHDDDLAVDVFDGGFIIASGFFLLTGNNFCRDCLVERLSSVTEKKFFPVPRQGSRKHHGHLDEEDQRCNVYNAAKRAEIPRREVEMAILNGFFRRAEPISVKDEVVCVYDNE